MIAPPRSLPAPAIQRCEMCRLRPFEVRDARWSRYEYAVCRDCYSGATPGACRCGFGTSHPRHLTLHQGWLWMNHVLRGGD